MTIIKLWSENSSVIVCRFFILIKREVSDTVTSLQILMKTITAVHLPKVGTQGRKEPAVTGHHSTSRVEVHIFRADKQEENH